MAKTQHRAHAAFAGRRFGSFSGKIGTSAGPHPVGVLTQHRGQPPLQHRRFGSFAGRGAPPSGPHPVGVLSQHRPHSAIAGRRYGSFAGKAGSLLNEWFLTGVEELEFAAELTASGDFAVGALVGQVGSIGLVASLTASGNFSFSVAPPVTPVTPGSRFIGPRVGLRANGELIILF